MSDVRAAAERQYPVRYGYGRARYGGMLITDDSKDVWDVLHQCLEDHQMLSQAYLAIEAELAACRDEVERWQQLARAQSQAIQAAKAECERLRVFERAMESMAAQMIHPKMTALEMANMQLEEPPS